MASRRGIEGESREMELRERQGEREGGTRGVELMGRARRGLRSEVYIVIRAVLHFFRV